MSTDVPIAPTIAAADPPAGNGSFEEKASSNRVAVSDMSEGIRRLYRPDAGRRSPDAGRSHAGQRGRDDRELPFEADRGEDGLRVDTEHLHALTAIV
jgi:hypothetical protein